MSKRNRNARVSIPKHLVDVVISTSGRWDFLEQCLNALRKQTLKPNIIIVDNASDEEERKNHEHLFNGVSSKRLKQHFGFAAANNQGAALGNAPAILFLNDDCILEDETAIQKMFSTIEDPTIGICGIKLLYPLSSTSNIRPPGKVQHVGIALNIKGDTYHPLAGWSANHPKANVSRDVFAVTGACLMVKRVLFEKVGKFDLVYGAGTYEDVDLCLKVRSIGQRVFVNTNAVGYHYAGATSEKKQTPFPLLLNSNIFKTRWQGSPLLAWDEWTYYYDFISLFNPPNPQ